MPWLEVESGPRNSAITLGNFVNKNPILSSDGVPPGQRSGADVFRAPSRYPAQMTGPAAFSCAVKPRSVDVVMVPVLCESVKVF